MKFPTLFEKCTKLFIILSRTLVFVFFFWNWWKSDYCCNGAMDPGYRIQDPGPTSSVSRHHLDLLAGPEALPSRPTCGRPSQTRWLYQSFWLLLMPVIKWYDLRSKRLPHSCSRPVSLPMLRKSANKRGLISFYALIQRALLVLSSTVCFSPCLVSDRIMILASQMEC